MRWAFCLYTKPAVVYKTSGRIQNQRLHFYTLSYHFHICISHYILITLLSFKTSLCCEPSKKDWLVMEILFLFYFNSFVAVRSVTFDDGGRSSCMLWSILSQFFVYILFSYTV